MIYVNGDSWSQISAIDYDYSWSSQLQKLITVPIVNESSGCGSNSRILSNLQKIYFSGIKPELVIIGLTSYSRWHLPSKTCSSWNIGATIINDRTGVKEEYALKWFHTSVFDQVEYVFQYYNIIWQINELCKKYLNCPVIFFNAFDHNIVDIETELFYTSNGINNWVVRHTENETCMYTQRYIDCFNHFKDNLRHCVRITTPWSSLLKAEHIDGPTGKHPFHPSEQGHQIICDFVLTNIKEKFPTLVEKMYNHG